MAKILMVRASCSSNHYLTYAGILSPQKAMAMSSSFCPVQLRAKPISCFPFKPQFCVQVKALSSQASSSPTKEEVPTRIGFLGLGIMGSPMAQNLIKAGCDVTVWNRTKSKCDPLISLGAKNKGLLSSSGRVLSGKTDFANCCSEPRDAIDTASQETMLSCTRSYSKSSGIPGEFRTFLSKVGAKSKGEDSDNGFSELEEIPLDTVEESTSGGESDDGLTSGSELSEDEGNGEDAVDESETDGKNKSSAAKIYPQMCKAIISSPAVATGTVLDKWVEEGNKVTESDATDTIGILRKRRLFVKALQLSEWLESKKIIELNEENVAARVALVSKVRGLFQAENYVKQLPKSLRTEWK